jgi:alkylation response protein AidB-like acyl-CoA dehydrogenase
MPFFQTPPALGNQYEADRVLRAYVARTFADPAARGAIEGELSEMGELAGGELYRMQLDDRENEPRLVSWDAWGHRVDQIEVSPLWRRAAVIAAERGVVATAYERKNGALSRPHQFALLYLFDGSTDVYSCPLAMTDGAAATLSFHRSPIGDRALPRLLSRDPATAWTSGQWMTERTGGSDVGLTETVARPAEDGRYRLYGTKWFTSATTSQMALTLARPEGNGPGGRGLALFYVETEGEAGRRAPGLSVNRLKDKLGTRKVPTAELTLDGLLATPVVGTTDGIRNITPMLNVTRTWNAIAAAGAMRRAVALARDYATKRAQFGALLTDKPLHQETLAWMQAETEAAFHLAFRVAELMGVHEAGKPTEREAKLFRLLTPLAKLTTGKQAVAVTSEALECFGGAGYIEDTGLPRIHRDAQVLPIWEGTTNVLSLDTLRAIGKEGGIDALAAEIAEATKSAPAELAAEAETARRAIAHATAWLVETSTRAPLELEGGARRLALTLGRATELALLVKAATWSLAHDGDRRPLTAAKVFARRGVDLIEDHAVDGLDALANDR